MVSRKRKRAWIENCAKAASFSVNRGRARATEGISSDSPWRSPPAKMKRVSVPTKPYNIPSSALSKRPPKKRRIVGTIITGEENRRWMAVVTMLRDDMQGLLTNASMICWIISEISPSSYLGPFQLLKKK